MSARSEQPVDMDEHEREALRDSVRAAKGPTLLQMLDDDLEAAWLTYDEVAGEDDTKKTATVRGRIRGLAQAITTVRSPFSRADLGSSSRAWADAIKATEDEAHARSKARGRG